jgi:hypothetical protein
MTPICQSYPQSAAVLLQEPRQRAIIDESAANGYQSSGAFQSF